MVSEAGPVLVVPTMVSVSDPVLEFCDIFAVIISMGFTRFTSKQAF
jgi:hypothetical protein